VPSNIGDALVEPATENFKGSFLDLLAKGKSVKCTFSSTDEDQTSTGTTYVSGSKSRSDFEVTYDEGTMTSHMVSDGKWFYVWSDGTPQGAKMEIAAVQEAETASKQVNNTSNAAVEDYDFKCSSWRADSDSFVIPADIEFVDMTQLFKSTSNTNGAEPTDPSSSCAACEYAPDEEAK
jgi:hypothetical protein